MLLESFFPIEDDSEFPIQNLPYGVFSTPDDEEKRVGVAIGEFVFDLSVLEAVGVFELPMPEVFSQPTLNLFMSLGKDGWQAVRKTLQEILSGEYPILQDDSELQNRALLQQEEVALHLPVKIGDYTDFYSSKEHATNVGKMFRDAENALLPNWKHLPVAYHGRASSVVVSGTNIHRPNGQVKPNDAPEPLFMPSQRMDFELEMGFFVGTGNELGQPIPIDEASNHIFGMVLVNDWSARDIQKWEYQPLGPFLAKNLATSISPWVVTMDALEPFKVQGVQQDPTPLPYLQGIHHDAYNIELEVSLQSKNMDESLVISRSNTRNLYWSMAQQLAHHTITGCNMQTGDLLASGTISGATPDSYGSMLELAWGGKNPIELENGETRSFLHDHDTVTMRGWCQGEGYRVGFGEVTGMILPARKI